MAAGLTLDSGALIAAEKGGRRIWALCKEALARDATVTVPAAVLAQAWRGENPVQIGRLLQGCDVEALDEPRARAVGRLLTRSRTRDVIDGAVVTGAVSRGDAIVSSDPEDMARLLAAAGRRLPILPP